MWCVYLFADIIRTQRRRKYAAEGTKRAEEGALYFYLRELSRVFVFVGL